MTKPKPVPEPDYVKMARQVANHLKSLRSRLKKLEAKVNKHEKNKNKNKRARM